MPNPYFQFKQFTIQQDQCAMKVTTDSCLFGSCLPPTPSGGERDWKILDIGSGSGLLALMYAQKYRNAIIDAIEIDQEAAKQASENVAACPWKDRINVIFSNAKTYLFQKQYDLIISNPPFYENELKSGNLKRNIALHHEGLTLNELLRVIKINLDVLGTFSLLLPFKKNHGIERIFDTYNFSIVDKVLVRQSVNHDYFRIIISGKFKSVSDKSTIINELAIRDDNSEYTNEFVQLLKNYYL